MKQVETEQSQTSSMQSGSSLHRYLPWLVWGMATLFYCYENFLQVSMNVIGPDLLTAFNLSATALGMLTSLYYYTYAAMQMPVGLLVDRYGPRTALTIASVIVGAGSLLFGLAHVIGIAVVGRLLIGLGSAFAVVSCFKLASTWFPLERFALLSGLTITVGFSGSIIGEYPLAVLVESIGWRANMISFSIIGFILAVLIWKVVRAHPHGYIKRESTHIELKPLQGLRVIMTHKQNWLAAVYGSLMFAPTITLGSAWGGMFMMSAYHIDRSIAVLIVSALYMGWIIGAPVFGWFSDAIRLRKPSLLIASTGLLLTLTPVIYLNDMPLFLVGALLFSVGFFSSGFLPAFSIVREVNASTVTATAMGFMNTMNSLGGTFAPYLVGRILDWHWGGLMENGARVYTLTDFHSALLLLPIMAIISLILVPFIRETHCHSAL